MGRIVAGVIGGFFAWMFAWVGIEMLLSALWPASYGAHQAAFQAAIENGGAFTADTTLLLIHLVLVTAVSAIAGWLSVLIARENKRAPLILSVLLLAMGLMKAQMSWAFVPLWYHVAYTTLLFSMALVGARLKK
jgi:heme A synthase